MTAADRGNPLSGLDGRRARFGFDVDPMTSDLPMVEGLLAGATEVDITPPPGLPKAGYSTNTTDGVGFRTRLRARVIHLRAGVASVAVVHCDLLGGSALLQHLVARRVALTTDVSLAGLMIGATHTHAGPGQFCGTDFYNRFASNRPGFDPDWTSFLVDRIAAAVEQAVADRSPARMAAGTTELWGATRNRSLPPHARNPEVDDRTELHRRYAEVEPRLHVIRVDREHPARGLEPLAASVVFSIHGTGVSSRADEYNADLWSSVTREVGDGVEASTGTRPVVGAIEGTHGDMTPAIRPGRAGYVEAARIGRQVGAAAAALHERLRAELSDDIELGAGFREVDLRRQRTVDGVTLPRRPAVGAALVAGAKENETPVIGRLWPFRAGSPRRRRRGGQGRKRVLLGRLIQRAYLPLAGFPRVVPFQVLRLGDTLLAGLPFEVTMAAGRRFESAVRAGTDGAGIERVVVSSVANEYFGYVTTPEEYELQYYEGGHTLYGPDTQPFLQAHLTRLATEAVTDGGVHDPVGRRDFDLRIGRFGPAPSHEDDVAREIDGPPDFVDLSSDEDAYWELGWSDVPPGDLHWHDPLVRVEASDGGGPWQPAADDGDGSIAVRHDGEHRGRHRYAARWYRPDIRPDRRHRFVLAENNGRPEIFGDPFD
jgi:neutral ceramidase